MVRITRVGPRRLLLYPALMSLGASMLVSCVGEQAQAAAHAQVRPYTVTRSYQFFGADRSKANSEVVAQVAYQPPSTKSFTIQKTSGGGQGPKTSTGAGP